MAAATGANIGHLCRNLARALAVLAAKIVGERAENAGKRIVVIIPSFGRRSWSTPSSETSGTRRAR